MIRCGVPRGSLRPGALATPLRWAVPAPEPPSATVAFAVWLASELLGRHQEGEHRGHRAAPSRNCWGFGAEGVAPPVAPTGFGASIESVVV